MPRVTDVILVNRSEQPVLSIRTRTRADQLPALIGSSYHQIGQYLEELGEIPADIPYVAYYNMDMQDLDVEIGFPVASRLEGKGDVQAGTIPAGKTVFSLHLGAYQELAQTYEDMSRWIGEQGLQPTGVVYEHYYNGPGRPESELLTKIFMLVN